MFSWRIARRFSGCGLGVVVCRRLRARDYPGASCVGDVVLATLHSSGCVLMKYESWGDEIRGLGTRVFALKEVADFGGAAV